MVQRPVIPPKVVLLPVHPEATPDDMEEAEYLASASGASIVWHISQAQIVGVVVVHPRSVFGLVEDLADCDAFKTPALEV